jgi:hypothetical protein
MSKETRQGKNRGGGGGGMEIKEKKEEYENERFKKSPCKNMRIRVS